jgi:acylphosphatase
MRGAIKRGIRAGATNEDDGSVSLTLEGPYRVTEEIVTMLMTGTPINNWGAQVDSVKEVKCDDQPRATADRNGRVVAALKQAYIACKAVEEHQVTTENVDKIKWSKRRPLHIHL